MVHADAFTASSVSNERTHRIELAGELDLATAPNLNDEFERAAACGPHEVVLDLSALTFIDCAGLRAVFNFSDRARALGWRLRVVRPPAQLARIFGLAALPNRSADRIPRDPVYPAWMEGRQEDNMGEPPPLGPAGTRTPN
jgi:anti-anti-sigma factor